MKMQVTSIILAGGKNLRLGRTKAFETVGGKRLIDRVIERVGPLASQILVVTSPETPDLSVAGQADIVVDLYPGYGPLGGIYTGLLSARTRHNVVVACDMPFLNTALLGYMIEVAGDFDAVVPRVDGGMVEPLHAIYSRDRLEEIRKRLENKQLSIFAFLGAVRVRYLEPEESKKLDPQQLSFFNINRQSDLDRAIAIETESQN